MARKHAKSNVKKGRGRPSKYESDFVKRVNEYYEKCLKENIMPFIEDIALLLGVSEDSIARYSKANKRFRGAMERINILQRKSLKKIALSNYNGAVFLLKANHGLVEKQHIIHAGDAAHPIRYTTGPMPVPIVEAEKQK